MLRLGSGIDSAAAGRARSRRGSAARQPHRRRWCSPNRLVRACDPLRRMHSDDREGARRARRRGKRPRQSLDQARNRQVASRRRSAAADRDARSRPASRRICSISSPTARTAHDPNLIRALAVAGFAASNIMLLSVSIWAGAEAETRNLFHWLSAIIALPALAYSGRIFFRSAWQAVRHGRTNMDVPISLGVLLAFGMSFYETVVHGPHAYFDAAISLLFVLLVGTHTRPHGARTRPAGGTGAGATFCAWRVCTARRMARSFIFPTNEIRTWMTHLAGGRRTRARRCDRHQGDIGNGRLAGVGRACAGPGGRRLESCGQEH